MAERWAEEYSARVRGWCEKVAPLGVDALVDAGLVAKGEFAHGSSIVAEELFARLCTTTSHPPPIH